MSGFADYEQYDALGLAELVRRGKVTPAELLEAAIERYQRSIEVHPTAEAHTFLGWTSAFRAV